MFFLKEAKNEYVSPGIHLQSLCYYEPCGNAFSRKSWTIFLVSRQAGRQNLEYITDRAKKIWNRSHSLSYLGFLFIRLTSFQ